MDRSAYAERRPYAVPESLGDLAGPRHGWITLPPGLGWTGRTDYNLDDEADRAVLYERVLVEAPTAEVLSAVLEGQLLRSLWHRLFLPFPVRRLWEARFGELTTAA